MIVLSLVVAQPGHGKVENALSPFRPTGRVHEIPVKMAKALETLNKLPVSLLRLWLNSPFFAPIRKTGFFLFVALDLFVPFLALRPSQVRRWL